MRRTLWLILALASVASAGSQGAQRRDRDMIAAIKDEGLHRSQVMETVGWLSDVYGPRLTGSPAIEDAKSWAMQQLRQWGVANVHEERFAFGKGWSLERFHAHMIEPQVMPIIGYPKSWTSSTTGTTGLQRLQGNQYAPRSFHKECEPSRPKKSVESLSINWEKSPPCRC